MPNITCFVCGGSRDVDYAISCGGKDFCSEMCLQGYYIANNMKVTIPAIEVSGGLTNTELRATPIPVLTTPWSVTKVMKTGNKVTTANTADQEILTYTVTAGKTFYLQYLRVETRLTTFATTATNFGFASLESPSGTKLITQMQSGAGITIQQAYVFNDLPVPAGTVIRVVCTPAATTSYTWQSNFGGYEL